jgi:Domain of unknown function (DUF222)
VHPGPAPEDPWREDSPARRVPGPDDFPEDGVDGWRLVPCRADWPDEAGYQAALAEEEEPPDPDLWEDPDNAPPPGLDDAELAALMAGTRVVTAAGFAAGTPLDAGPGCTALMGFADDAAGPGDRYAGTSDDEVVGAVCAWDRIEAHAAARKHAAVAELIRRRPEPGCTLAGEAQMPLVWDEFTAAELAAALAESRFAAENLLDAAHDLQVKLPGTMAVFRSGVLRQDKVEIIARAARVLDPAEARAAEALVLGRAGRLTPGGLRAAIARAVLEVAPDKARKRREEAAGDARVERWPEDSGNAALAGRELPPAVVLAADQRVTWWAKELKKAGLPGDMDQLRARAYLDILLGVDSRPSPPAGHGTDGTSSGGADGHDGRGQDGRGQDGGQPGDHGPGGGPPTGSPAGGAVPPGFVGRVNLTIPLTTVLDLADRPGEIGGIGPIDPALARDLARAAARNPKTTWCVTVTDQDGHAIGHGCARPEPRRSRAKRQKPGGHDPPRWTGNTDGRGFTVAVAGRPGPAGAYGTWRLSTGAEGQPDLIVAIGPIASDECDHRHEAKGHDPGATLRHLTQIRHATCTSPTCRRPASQCDFEHNIPYQAGGRTCLCNGNPTCRHDHRLKQDRRWKVEQVAPAVIRWTTPTGRQYTTEATRHPI